MVISQMAIKADIHMKHCTIYTCILIGIYSSLLKFEITAIIYLFCNIYQVNTCMSIW